MAKLGCVVKLLPLGLALACGCMIGPEPANPLRVADTLVVSTESNPLWVPQRPEAYALVFDKTYEILNEYFEIARADRFAGQIHTKPVIVAGLLDSLTFGFYAGYELTEATLQTVSRHAEVFITPADSGGYYIDLRVYKSLEDLPRPTHASGGAAVIRSETRTDREYQVIDPLATTRDWIPIGQDHALERTILARLKACL